MSNDAKPNLFDHLLAELGGEETSRGIKVGEATLQLKWNDDGQTVEIVSVLISPQGTGLGTRFVEALHSFCDAGGKELRVVDATNPDFWRKFPWLSDGEIEMDFESEYTDGDAIEFWYTPAALLV